MRRLTALLAVVVAALVGCTVGNQGSAAPVTNSTAPTAVASSAPSADDRAVHVAAASDLGASDDTDAVLRGVSRSGASAMLMLGDLSYGEPGGEQQWCSWVLRRLGQVRALLLAGNHDDGRNGFIDDFADCLPPPLPGTTGQYGRQYAFDMPTDKPLVRFVMVSPGIDFGHGELDYREGSKRYDWTRDQIRDARAQGIPFVVVGVHKPCLTIGRYGCDSGQDLMNLLINERVDLVLNGHEHHYQRTKQLTNHVDGCRRVKANRYDADCVADPDTHLDAGAGTVFVTVGTGGAKLRSVRLVDREARYFTAWSAANADPSHGFANLVITADSLTATFDNASTGSYTDTFTITRR